MAQVTETRTTCAVVIHDRRLQVIRTCGQKASHELIFDGDLLFAICSRHDARIRKAIPELIKT